MDYRIPREIHVVWIGDESRRPDECIDTWRRLNPGWKVRVWGNEALEKTSWVNTRHMKDMARRELCGVADLMRWEILYQHGGFAIDADAECIRPLEDWIFDCEAFACWENELARPRLIANGYVATIPKNEFFAKLIIHLHERATVTDGPAWATTGPMALTTAYHAFAYTGLTIWPSHLFMPRHLTGTTYTGGGSVFGTQRWASTRGRRLTPVENASCQEGVGEVAVPQ